MKSENSERRVGCWLLAGGIVSLIAGLAYAGWEALAVVTKLVFQSADAPSDYTWPPVAIALIVLGALGIAASILNRRRSKTP